MRAKFISGKASSLFHLHNIYSLVSWSLELDFLPPHPPFGLLCGCTIRLSYERSLSAIVHRSPAMPLWAWCLPGGLKVIPPAPIPPTRHTVPEAARSSGRAHLHRSWVSLCVALPHHSWCTGARESIMSKWELLQRVARGLLSPTGPLHVRNAQFLQSIGSGIGANGDKKARGRQHHWDSGRKLGPCTPEPRRLCPVPGL